MSSVATLAARKDFVVSIDRPNGGWIDSYHLTLDAADREVRAATARPYVPGTRLTLKQRAKGCDVVLLSYRVEGTRWVSNEPAAQETQHGGA